MTAPVTRTQLHAGGLGRPAAPAATRTTTSVTTTCRSRQEAQR
jgi:hypothetical protein